jgi:hypothetical protein
VREGCELDVSFDEGYLLVRPLDSHDWAFDYYMVHLAVMLSFLPLVLKIYTTRNMEIHDVSWVTFQAGVTDVSYL